MKVCSDSLVTVMSGMPDNKDLYDEILPYIVDGSPDDLITIDTKVLQAYAHGSLTFSEAHRVVAPKLEAYKGMIRVACESRNFEYLDRYRTPSLFLCAGDDQL
jgi:hypothetical protein